MKSELIPYEKKHLLPLLDQKENLGVRDFFLSAASDSVQTAGSFTLIIDGKTACCGGVMMYWAGRGQIWSVFNEEFKDNFVPVFRGIKKFLNEQLKTYRRLEVSIPIDYPQGVRRIEMLGFKLECALAKKFLPDGRDCSLYALVRE